MRKAEKKTLYVREQRGYVAFVAYSKALEKHWWVLMKAVGKGDPLSRAKASSLGIT